MVFTGINACIGILGLQVETMQEEIRIIRHNRYTLRCYYLSIFRERNIKMYIYFIQNMTLVSSHPTELVARLFCFS